VLAQEVVLILIHLKQTIEETMMLIQLREVMQIQLEIPQEVVLAQEKRLTVEITAAAEKILLIPTEAQTQIITMQQLLAVAATVIQIIKEQQELQQDKHRKIPHNQLHPQILTQVEVVITVRLHHLREVAVLVQVLHQEVEVVAEVLEVVHQVVHLQAEAVEVAAVEIAIEDR